jgi:hypothetical protein
MRLNFGQDLDAAWATSDQSYPLAGDIVWTIITRRVREFAFEVMKTRNIGPFPLVQTSDCRNEDVGRVSEFLGSQLAWRRALPRLYHQKSKVKMKSPIEDIQYIKHTFPVSKSSMSIYHFPSASFHSALLQRLRNFMYLYASYLVATLFK